jgi:hypothetical protein
MTDPRSFDEAFTEFTVRSGRWRDTSPSDLLARWDHFVAKCELGYPGDAEDYFNDLTSRDAIERSIRSEELSNFPEIFTFKENVARIDARFCSLLRPNVFPRIPVKNWWSRGIVCTAGQRLANDLRDRYAVVIEVG